MRYGDSTYEEIRDKAEQQWLVVVPTGCTEQQGPHLPVDFDTWFVQQVTEAASERAAKKFGVQSLVLPAVPFGPTPEHRNFGSGYIDLPRDIHESMLSAILTSLAAQGFQKIIVWRGCGAHEFMSTIERFNSDVSTGAKAYLPGHPYHDIWCRLSDPSVPGGHADSFTTSIALHLRPEAVRKDRIVDPKSTKVDWADPDMDFSQHSSTGVIGDPTHASAELGAQLWEATVDEIAGVLNDIAQDTGDIGQINPDRLHFLQHGEERTDTSN